MFYTPALSFSCHPLISPFPSLSLFTVCEDGGDLICCNDCPRSYHRSCIDDDKTTLPPNWSCDRCQTDLDVLPQEEIPMNASSTDIQSAYSSFVYSEGFEYCCDILTKLSMIVSKLISSDHGELICSYQKAYPN